ncbi:MAG: hypothetical protein F6J87_22385, partial [Spirulina sp. SIO3F2]|nr:hypothetical protein [Spirulina sp. SIO3F2]
MMPSPASAIPVACEILAEPINPNPFDLRDAAIALARAQYAEGEVDAALQTLAEIPSLSMGYQLTLYQKPQDIAPYSLAIAQAYLDFQQPDRAWVLAEDALTRVEHFHHKSSRIRKAYVVDFYARAGNFPRAWEIAESIPRPYSPSPYAPDNGSRFSSRAKSRHFIALAHLKFGDVQGAKLVIDTINSEWIYTEAQGDLAAYLAAQGA